LAGSAGVSSAIVRSITSADTRPLRARPPRSRQADVGESTRACGAQPRIVAALHDAEECLACARLRRERALAALRQRSDSAMAALGSRRAAPQPDAFVELHHDVGNQAGFEYQLHARAKASTMAPSRCERKVTQRSSTGAVRRAHDLEAAGIGEDRPRQFMNWCKPPSAAMRSAPGRSIR